MKHSHPHPHPHSHPHPHTERHFSSSEVVRDLVIGMSDGLTVPFALAAGLIGATANNHLVVLGGMAEIAAGSIAMGLGGFLAARGDAEHYAIERDREWREIRELPLQEEAEIYEIFEKYGVSHDESRPVLEALKRRPEAWVDFMMRFELGLEEPHPGRAVSSAATIAAAYVFGGLIPLFPYMTPAGPYRALSVSVLVTLAALAAFGFIKGQVTGTARLRSAAQTTLIGGLAAAAAFALARLFAAA